MLFSIIPLTLTASVPAAAHAVDGTPPAITQTGHADLEGRLDVQEIAPDGSAALAMTDKEPKDIWYVVSLPDLKATRIGGQGGAFSDDSSALYFVDDDLHMLNRMDLLTKRVTQLPGDMNHYTISGATADRVLLKGGDGAEYNYRVYDVGAHHILSFNVSDNMAVLPALDLSRMFVVAKQLTQSGKTAYSLQTYDLGTGDKTAEKPIGALEGFDLRDALVSGKTAYKDTDKAMLLARNMKDENRRPTGSRRVYRLSTENAKVTPLTTGSYTTIVGYGSAPYVLVSSSEKDGVYPSEGELTEGNPIEMISVATGDVVWKGKVSKALAVDHHSNIPMGISSDGKYVVQYLSPPYKVDENNQPVPVRVETVDLSSGETASVELGIDVGFEVNDVDYFEWSPDVGTLVTTKWNAKAGTTTWTVYGTGVGVAAVPLPLKWLRSLGVWGVVAIAAVVLVVIAIIAVVIVLVVRRRRKRRNAAGAAGVAGASGTVGPVPARFGPASSTVPDPRQVAASVHAAAPSAAAPVPVPSVPLPVSVSVPGPAAGAPGPSGSATGPAAAGAPFAPGPVQSPAPVQSPVAASAPAPAPALVPESVSGPVAAAAPVPRPDSVPLPGHGTGAGAAAPTPPVPTPSASVTQAAPAPAFCTRCGAALGGSNARFCPQCGAPVR